MPFFNSFVFDLTDQESEHSNSSGAYSHPFNNVLGMRPLDHNELKMDRSGNNIYLSEKVCLHLKVFVK